MKKVLSLLASIGLVATTAMTVVACATTTENNPNVNIDQVKAWFKNAQPSEQKEGKMMLIAIGGRYNSDTLSYLGTLDRLVNTDTWSINANNILDQNRITNIEDTLTHFITSTSSKPTEKVWQDPIRKMVSSVNSIDWEHDPNQVSVIARKYFWHNPQVKIDKMEFHNILVDNIENFWNQSLGKAIVNDILAPQMDQFLQFAVNEPDLPIDPALKELIQDTDKYEKFIKNKTKSFLEALQNESKNGPWFLVVRSGKLVGIKTGFRNYYEFNSQYTKTQQRDNSLQTNYNNLVGNTWNEFAESIANSLSTGIDWITNNFFTSEKEISSSKIIAKNSPNSTTNSAAWNTNTSGTSNITDLDKPRGEEVEKPDDGDKDNEKPGENPTQTYHFTFLD